MITFKNILCVLDTAKECKPALERAVTLAENYQARLTVVDVIEFDTAGIGRLRGGPTTADLHAAMESAHEQKLENLIEPFRERIEIKTRVLTGTPFLEIIREVLRLDYDLVIKTPETREWLNRFFGSDDMHLLRKCPCPVWLIKPEEPKPYRRILAAVDVNDAYPPSELKNRRALNMRILQMASSLALSESAELHVACAWKAIGESIMRGTLTQMPEEKIMAYVEEMQQMHEASLDLLLREMTTNAGQVAVEYIKQRKYLLKGKARKEIPQLAKKIEADLVVMGTVARTGVPGFIMGNTAETILNQIDCSVLAIKPPGFLTPVRLDD